MITPYDLFLAAIVTLIGCAAMATVCTWLADTFCSNALPNCGAGVFSDLLIVVLFSLGPICTIPLWWVFFVLMSNGRLWN